MTTVHTRYEVGDALCGVITHEANRYTALECARRHENAHRQDNIPDPVTVFDRMARPGATQVWTPDGRGVSKRTR